jgi:hypothetical protein
MLPDKEIHAILQKFGHQISAYLQSIGYFDLEGPYEPTDIMDQVAMRKFLAASKAKNAEVWSILEKWLLPEMVGNGEKFIQVYGLQKQAIPVREIATEYIETRGGDLIKRMTLTDKRKLTAYIWQNSMKNERPLARQILKEPNLSSIVDNSGARTRAIIRTERGRAIRGGAHEFAGKAGATTTTWHTVGDSRVRKEHQALNGTTIEMGGEFESKVSKTKTIYQNFPAQKEVNCRCWLEYGFDKDVATTPSPSMSTLEDLYGEVTPSQKAPIARKVAPVTEAPRKVAPPSVKTRIEGVPDKFADLGVTEIDTYSKFPGLEKEKYTTYRVKSGNYKTVFTSDNEEIAFKSIKAYSEIPEELKGRAYRISLIGGDDPANAYKSSKYGRKFESNAIADIPHGTITKFGTNGKPEAISKNTLAHELTHTVDLNGKHSRNIDWINAVKRDQRYPTNYAKEAGFGEDLAESVMLHVSDPKFFTSKFPARAAYIEKNILKVKK